MTIKKWIKENNLHAKFANDYVFAIKDVGTFVVVGTVDTSQNIFNSDLELITDDNDKLYVQEWGAEYYAYRFGGKWYYTPVDKTSEPEFNLLKYLGKAKLELEMDWSHLGVHGGYELLNGSRSYDDWCEKAKFIGLDSVGLAEKNTLAGTISFQVACKDAGMKPVLGETVSVKSENDEFICKLYVKNKEGWRNLLRINKAINVDNDGFVSEDELLSRSDGLICVFENSNLITASRRSDFKKAFGDDLYYQIDTVEWRSNKKDEPWLKAMKKYIESFMHKIPPVLINDSYYLDKSDAHIKKKLNDIGNLFENESLNQQFKTLDEAFADFAPLFRDDDDRLFEIFQEAVSNSKVIADACDYQIDTDHKWLPRFEIKDIPEKYLDNETSEDLFWQIIEEGIAEKLDHVDDLDPYLERVQEEVRVVQMGDLLDYFLILWDIIRWCRENDILVGPARGSAGGSLISYLLNITQIDPIEHGLLFERFLNEHRAATSLPDIDVDFEASRRDEVKRYMEWKYGKDHVASIGTFGTMKLKQALKDLGRKDQDYNTLNYMNSIIGGEGEEDGRVWSEIFRIASKSDNFKDFVIKNPDLINDIQLVINQQRSSSIHASAVIITPKEDADGNDMTIYDWMPVKEVDGVLVSEWEHKLVEKAGFLKEDILGIAQLDKFAMMRRLIKEFKGEDIDIYEIPFDDKGVYELFHKGYNEDVFQFGSDGLKGYSKEVKPDKLEHLTAMNALHRPSAMEVGADKEFVELKHGRKEPTYDYMLEEIQKETRGLFIYQEQTMLAAQILGDFNLTRADGLRKALTKKGIGTSHLFKDEFIENAIKNGCPEEEAKEIWNKLEAFTGYGFNKAHATAYAILGYFSQWFKYHYPLEFWTTSLQYASDNAVHKRISEIRKMSEFIKLSPPDINKSGTEFQPDPETNSIYWSLNSVKQLGPKAVENIIEERKKNGLFFSLEEFIDRVDTSVVNKRVVENLIISGAFDEVANIDRSIERWNLITEYYELTKRDDPLDEDKFEDDKIGEPYWWSIKQKELSGYGYIKYRKLVAESSLKERNYLDETEFYEKENDGVRCAIGGEIMDFERRSSKNGPFYKIYLDANNEEIIVTMWNESYKKYQQKVRDAKGKHVLISGNVKYDGWQKKHVLHTDNETEMIIL